VISSAVLMSFEADVGEAEAPEDQVVISGNRKGKGSSIQPVIYTSDPPNTTNSISAIDIVIIESSASSLATRVTCHLWLSFSFLVILEMQISL
jgi:hypothetical protein